MAAMKRVVTPEILDSLPHDHPAALANRRDLRLVNALMGNHRWMEKRLNRHLKPEDKVLEIGAGTGDLGLRLRRKALLPNTAFTGLDLWPKPEEWPEEWEWMQTDLSSYEGYGRFTVILANLIMHQFSEEVLRKLGRLWRNGNARLLLISEPVRRSLHQWQLRLLPPLGFHPVSRHDARVSVAAGFRRGELPQLLGLEAKEWMLFESETCFGACRLAAERRVAS